MLGTKYIFVVAQKALIKKNNKILVVKRSKTAKAFPEYWDLPGGKIEHGEEVKKSLKREVKEETTLNVNVFDPVFVHRQQGGSFGQAYISIIKCKIKSGEVKISDEHLEYKWVTKEEALKLKCEPYLKAFLEQM